MSTENKNVRPTSLPEVNPEAMYPRAGIVGRVVGGGVSGNYLDLRGPVLFDVKPLPNVPLETRRYHDYLAEVEAAKQSREGTGYSPYAQTVDANGFSVYSGPVENLKPMDISRAF
mgnify:CR=1 FL=1|tara:strand:- start:504 stop:848 length:345 start_codon:yes stop_codon:yes gene_type:complete